MNRITLFCASLTGAAGVRLLDFIFGYQTVPNVVVAAALGVTFIAGATVVVIAWTDQ